MGSNATTGLGMGHSDGRFIGWWRITRLRKVNEWDFEMGKKEKNNRNIIKKTVDEIKTETETLKNEWMSEE